MAVRSANAGFSAVYYNRENRDQPGNTVNLNKEPIVIRGVGNITVFGVSSRYSTDFPSVLMSKVAPEEFKDTIHRLNEILKKKVTVNLAWFCLGCAFCCCTFGCSFCPVVYLNRRTKEKIQKFLEKENIRLYHKLGLHLKLSKQQCDDSLMIEYVIVVDYIPRAYIYRPE